MQDEIWNLAKYINVNTYVCSLTVLNLGTSYSYRETNIHPSRRLKARALTLSVEIDDDRAMAGATNGNGGGGRGEQTSSRKRLIPSTQPRRFQWRGSALPRTRKQLIPNTQLLCWYDSSPIPDRDGLNSSPTHGRRGYPVGFGAVASSHGRCASTSPSSPPFGHQSNWDPAW